MMHFYRVVFCFLMLLVLAGPQTAMAAPRQAAPAAAALERVAPLACPPGGCAAGQRLSYRLDFEVGVYDKLIKPNVKVCVYIPTGWYDPASLTLHVNGGETGLPYSQSADCQEDQFPPAGYMVLTGAEANFDQNYFRDTLELSFRIAAQAVNKGSVLMRVFEHDGGTWQRTSQAYTSQIQVAPRATVAYFAANADACLGHSPCYLNSDGDLADGVGTGLRDAIEAFDPAQNDLTVQVLGTVALRGESVRVDKAVVIDGGSNAVLTVESAAYCAPNPLLDIRSGATLKDLVINDGACSGANDRPLVAVNNASGVLIESNNLTGGSNALEVTGSSDNLTVRYNQISANSGYALRWDNASPTGSLALMANNLYQNRTGDQVECSLGAATPNANRRADHNYWGSTAPSAASTHCTLAVEKRLGAPIALGANGVGLDVEQVTVTTTKERAFANQIAYQRTGGTADFEIVIVNHGGSTPGSIPFGGTFSMPNLCSNVWDVFLADGAALPTGELDLFVRYNSSAACTAAVETSTFCGQTASPQNYPLWWYDPRGKITSGWDTTGQSPAGTDAGGVTGQTTSCLLAEDEIKVAIDATGRPNLANDLNFTPLLVGLPVTNTWVALASDSTVTLNWTTVNEPNVGGYLVLRSLNPAGPFEALTDEILREGSSTTGSSYTYVDTGLVNKTTYYYRLKVQRSDGGYTFSDVAKIVVDVATVTPTPTITNTPTASRTPTPSRTFTPRPTLTPSRRASTLAPAATRAVTGTATRALTPTKARGTQATPTPGGYPPPAETQSGTPLAEKTEAGYPVPLQTQSGYPGPLQTPTGGEQANGKPSALTPTQPTRTASATAMRTAAPTLSYAEQVRSSSRYISLILGLVLGGVIFFGATWIFFLRKRTS